MLTRYEDGDFPLKVERYQRRFLNEAQFTKLLELWRTSTIPCGRGKRHDRMLWTSRWMKKEYPELHEMAAYKELDSYLAWSGV